MIDKNIIKEIVAGEIESTDMFIVDINVTPDNRIVVELDARSPIDIDSCARITRAIEAALDRDAEDFELEVGSAGLTSPFKVKEQYIKNIGNDIDLLTRNGRKITGHLVEVNDDDFIIEVSRKVKEPGAKRPSMITEPLTIAFDNVKKASYHLDFK
ncbi:MAG: ribosome assembly cofactor RimP [Clostridiales bacterium]|nr:ribosome assembly cofactor RimP [Clostridiales bacterium]